MTLRRFFLPPEQLTVPRTTITGDLFRHLVTVLRFNAGDSVILADGQGREMVATIVEIGKEALVVQTGDERIAPAQPAGPSITLYQGLPKGEKVDLILQKATELGIHQVILFAAARSVPRLDQERRESRLVRWQRIVREASRQAGRETVPLVGFADSLSQALQQGEHSVKLLLWEGEHDRHLKELLRTPPPDTVAFIVGPEGGLTSGEAELAGRNGYQPTTMGRRILRTETASLALLAILQYQWGDLG